MSFVAAIFYAVYSASQRCSPLQTPSAHLAVESSFQQFLLMAVAEAVCSTHRLRAMLRTSGLLKEQTIETVCTSDILQDSIESCKLV